MKRATTEDEDEFDTDCISIHALVKRATAEGVSQLVALVISIHALVMRAAGGFCE